MAVMLKVRPAEFSGLRPRLGKPSSLGRLRRQVSIIGPERTFRRAIATDYRTFGRDLLAELRESGVFERLAQDAARYMDSQDATRRREGAKQEDPEPIGRGGVPLSPGHQRELRRVFSRGAIGFAADLVEDPIDAFRLSFASTLDENYHDLFDVGGRAARLSLGVSGSFNLRSPAIAEALDQRANLLSGSIADDVFDRMITVIAQEFYLEGKGPLEVARSLEGEFDWLERDRAERIARTETLGVTEEAQWMTYGVSGVEWKRWMTTLDGRERETHFEAHGQIKALDEPFEVGADELMFPGDPEGSPGEICNCRCASQAIVHESQVFNDRAVWDGENDPDEFSRERVEERRDQEFNERLGEFEGEKRAPILRRFFGSWFKAEREYERDEIGRFGTGGGPSKPEAGDGETGGKPLADLPAPASRALASAETRIQDQEFETAFAVDGDGNVLLEKDGGANSVEFTPDEVGRMRGGAFTHNHPGGRSFSTDDIVMASTLGMTEMRAVGPGGVSYRMQSDRGTTWPNRERIQESFQRHRSEVDTELRQAMSEGRLTVNEANNAFNHEVWRRVAPEIGLRYERTKR